MPNEYETEAELMRSLKEHIFKKLTMGDLLYPEAIESHLCAMLPEGYTVEVKQVGDEVIVYLTTSVSMVTFEKRIERE